MNYAQLQQASASLMERVLGRKGMCNPSKWAAPEGFPAPPPLFQELRFKLPLFDATNPSLPTDQVDTANDNLVAGATLAACTPYADCLGDETSAYPRGFTTDGDMAGGGLTDNDVTVSQAGSSFDSVSNSQHDGIWDTQHDLVFEWANPQQEVQDYADGELKRVCMVRIYWGDVYAQDLDIYTCHPPCRLRGGKESPGRTGWTLRSRVRGQQLFNDHDAQCIEHGGIDATFNSGLEADAADSDGVAHKAGTPDASGPTSMYHEYMLDGCGSSDPSRQQQTPSVWIRLRRPAMLSYCASQATPESGWQAFGTCSCERGSRAEAAQYSIREIQVVATTHTLLPPPPTPSPPPHPPPPPYLPHHSDIHDPATENDNSVAWLTLKARTDANDDGYLFLEYTDGNG